MAGLKREDLLAFASRQCEQLSSAVTSLYADELSAKAFNVTLHNCESLRLQLGASLAAIARKIDGRGN